MFSSQLLQQGLNRAAGRWTQLSNFGLVRAELQITGRETITGQNKAPARNRTVRIGLSFRLRQTTLLAQSSFTVRVWPFTSSGVC